MTKREVVASSLTTEVEEVFNLIVEGEFSFVANGVVAHSFSYFRALRILWWTCCDKLRTWVRDEPGIVIGSAEEAEPNAAPDPARM
jgi:hypothetical protein